MKGMIRLAVDVASQMAAYSLSVAARSRAFALSESIAECDALITDNSASALSAVALGKYVLVLHPFRLAMEARELLQASGRAMPAHRERFQPSIQCVKRALDGGQLGDPGLLRIHCWQESQWADENAVEREIDLAVWLLGSRPSEVYAIERPDYWQAHLGFMGGRSAIIDIHESLPSENAYYSLSLIASQGAAYADDHHNTHLLLSGGGTKAILASQADAASASMVAGFARSINAGHGFSPDWSDTESAIHVAKQVRRAANNQCVIVGDSHA